MRDDTPFPVTGQCDRIQGGMVMAWANQLGKLNRNNNKRGGHNVRGRGMGRVGGRGGRENQGRIVIVVAIANAKHS